MRKPAIILTVLLAVGLAYAAIRGVSAATSGTTYGLSVVSVSTPGQAAYAVYWATGKGQVTLERQADGGAFQPVVTTSQASYLDTGLSLASHYTYRIGSETASDATGAGGTPSISGITVKAGTTTKDSASLIVYFKTEQLAKSQVFYGETRSYGQETSLDSYLNQSHTILIEHLKPSTTYHLKLHAVSDSGVQSDSDDQTFTTATPTGDLSVTQVILQALQNAFSALGQALQFK